MTRLLPVFMLIVVTIAVATAGNEVLLAWNKFSPLFG